MLSKNGMLLKCSPHTVVRLRGCRARYSSRTKSIVEAIVEQLTTLQGAEVTLRLEIDAEVASGLDRSKVRTLLENANTLNFIDKVVK